MGSGWRWVARGWPGVGWMKEGGQAERSTRGGLRGRPGGARGEKLEKGRFKYQAPRGGPRSVSVAPRRPPSTTPGHPLLLSVALSARRLSPRLASFSVRPCRLSLFPPSFARRLYGSSLSRPRGPPSRAPHYQPVLRLCTHTNAGPVRRPVYTHRARRTLTHTHAYRSSAREKAS